MPVPTLSKEKSLRTSACVWLVLQLDWTKCNVGILWSTEVITFGSVATVARLLHMFVTVSFIFAMNATIGTPREWNKFDNNNGGNGKKQLAAKSLLHVYSQSHVLVETPVRFQNQTERLIIRMENQRIVNKSMPVVGVNQIQRLITPL